MAKKKEEAPAPGAPAWMATFSDLMNLLLCFFVLLFAMSSVDTAKFNELAQSFANTFSIFKAGGAFVGDGNMVANGATQLNNLDEHTSTMGQESESDVDKENIYENAGDTEELLEYYENKVAELEGKIENLENAENAAQAEKEEVASAVYDEITDLANRYNLGDYVEFGMDKAYNYVKIDVKGSVLFESNSAEIKEDAKPILLKIGDILKEYDEFGIEIIGHTDNVPIKSGPYADNDYLSAARAIETAQYLMESKNLDPAKLSFSGKGEREPVDTNATADGRERNRRIEFRIYAPFDK
ncbi:MAG: flagellar motor protein MotB [Lachnospiraceae bacterium]|nr:flagellar motor protein MotB [Lachnospiraceae bacterium]